MQEKGIEDAISAVEMVNEKLGFEAFTLDIYGQIWEPYKDRFKELIRAFPHYIRYCGTIDSDKSVNILKGYFALLFPTFYEGEGFAGTLIDAYSSGLPVIASDWQYNAELINVNTGYVYQTKKQDEFVRILEDVALNPTMILRKKKKCIEEAAKYSIEKAVGILIQEIGSE